MSKTLTKSEALATWNAWHENGFNPPELTTNNDKVLRNKIVSIYESLKDGYKSFEYDVKFGIELMKLFDSLNISSLRLMSNDCFWRYISLVIAPDIVAHRHGYKVEYYFDKPNRVWFKSIWWLIYLSWQGSLAETERILLSGKFSTDTTVAMCERTGQDGTNIELYRAIVRKISTLEKFEASQIKRVMKLNTVKSLVVEPSLFDEGIKGYVNSLFEELNIR
jgi:hypothetical protein